MFEQTSYDVLVVGARCAGAAVAMLMVRRGLRVLVVERGDYGADTLSTHALMRAGVLQLERWGLLPHVQAAGTPAVRSTTFHYGDEAIEIAIPSSHGVDALYAPRRAILDSTLVDMARASGAEVHYGRTLVALDRAAGGRIRGATLLDRAGATSNVQVGLVVGADGIGSTVARLVSAPVLRRGEHASAIVYGYWNGLRASGYHWYYREGASVGVIPTNGEQHCVFAAVPAGRFRDVLRGTEGYLGVLAATAPQLGSGLAGAAIAGPLRAFGGRPGFFRQSAGPGWALVGDAGYFKDPLTAHGMTDALRDAEFVARAAALWSDHAFAEYAALRDELSMPLFKITDAIASFDWDLEQVKQHHRDLTREMKREVALLAALDEPRDSAASQGPPVSHLELAPN